MSLSDTEAIVNTHKDGRTTVKKTVQEVVVSGVIYLTVTFTTLRQIDAILDVKTTVTSPATTAYGPNNIVVNGLIVGFTLFNVAAGTTLTYEVIALGE